VRLQPARLFPLLLMLALALLTFWLERAVQEEAVHPSLRRHDPDYTVENFELRRFGAQGALEATLAAAKMIHYPDDDSTELVAPRMVQSRPDEPRLTVSAERGALSRSGDEVFLYENVLLVREAGPARPETRMRTTFLHVIGAKSLVRTDREVTVSEPDRSISGRGMEYHNDTGQLYLRERVRGRFEPRKEEPAQQ
jgi:lipopolysaccharide export system protein LptC